MTTATQGRFPAFGLTNTTPAEKSLPNMAPPFGSNIWANNKNVIGSTYQRDAPGSRDSEEASPTTVSGSAQLTHQSEAETPSWPRPGTWGALNGSTQGRSNSGTASPSQTRDGLGPQSLQESRTFASRPSIAQNGNGFPNGLTYSSVNQTPTLDAAASLRRGSQAEFSGFGQNRENSISGSRAHDFSSHTTPGSMSHDLTQYFEGNSRGSISRPPGPIQTTSFPTTIPSQALHSAQRSDQGLSNLLSNTLSLHGNRGNDAVGNNFNPLTLPFNPSSSTQTWNGDITANDRVYSQIYQQNRQQSMYGEQVSTSYTDLRRGSIDRVSPVSASLSRNGVSSPRLPPGVGSRQDSWPQSRPISRGHSVTHEFERQAVPAYSQPSNNYWTSGQYYNNNFTTPYAPQLQSYEPYGQSGGLRTQIPMHQYNLVNPYIPHIPSHMTSHMSVPGRPSRDQDPGKGIRSVLLEEFRKGNRNNKHYELKDIMGHVVEFSGDQHGSRFIQEKLQSANSDEKDLVFQEIKSNAIQLMKDVFGNYVIQKFFDHGSQVQKTILAKAMKGKVSELSTQTYACRVVQKALDHVLVEEQEDIIEEIKADLMRITKHVEGNHVVQKCIVVAPQVIIPFIMNVARGQVRSLSSDQFGCRVIQRVIDHGTLEEKRELLDEFHASSADLAKDLYGNYVCQHVLECKVTPPEDKDRFAKVVREHFIEFSTNKQASNVVEKSFTFGTVEHRQAILATLDTFDKGRLLFDRLILDQFGNYIIQSVIRSQEGQNQIEFMDKVEGRLTILGQNTDTRTARQMNAIVKVLESQRKALRAAKAKVQAKADSTQTAESNPSTGLQIDVHTTANTPALTSENSSPRSTSSPSTKSGDEAVNESAKLDPSLSLHGQPEVLDVDNTSS